MGKLTLSLTWHKIVPDKTTAPGRKRLENDRGCADHAAYSPAAHCHCHWRSVLLRVHEISNGTMVPIQTQAPDARTQTHPTANEKAELAVDRDLVAGMDAQILALEASLGSLKAKRRLVQDRLDAYTYPVLILPNEIVSEIFTHFLPVYPKCPPLLGPLSPYLLCQICRKWRDIALTTPTLWRAISLSLGRTRFRRISQKHDLLKAWLKLSGSCPLSIKLYNDYDDLGNPKLRPFLRTIQHHRARWGHLSLPSLDNIMPEIKLPALPWLRSLEVRDDEHATTPLSFLAAPLLRKLTLNSYADAHAPSFAWSQLTVLSVGWIEPYQCADVLHQLVNVNYCRLNIDPVDNFKSLQDVTLPFLETLILSAAFPNGHFMRGSPLDRLTLPALQRLHVSQNLLDPGDPIATLTQLVSKSARNLHTLCVPGAKSPHLYQRAFPSVMLILKVTGKLDNMDPFLELSDDKESTQASGDEEWNMEGTSDYDFD
ncbi:hypothetical protein C8R47DRAFT_75071 [Mycena vitilis]|nr:hypothetical protein C8R47DRAFT_75071 [Mycena vitilis]